MDDQSFSCTLCGECCSGDMKIFPNIFDIYRMGIYLKMTHSRELFEQGILEWSVGQNGINLPKIRFKTYPYPFCPFLINDFDEEKGLRGLCSLHPDLKPLICKLAPLSREVDLETGLDQFSFIPPHPECPGCGRGQAIDIQSLRRELKEELEFEVRYYHLLAETASKDPSVIRDLFLFQLNMPPEELLPLVKPASR